MPQGPILVVDDEPINLDAMRLALGAVHKLIYARDGGSALEAIAKHKPALVLLDIRMPGMDGYEVCRAIKANPATEYLPVIFVTSLSDVGDEARGFEAGAVDFIVKPISPLVVRARVQTHLSLVRHSRLERSHRDAIYMLSEAGHFNDNDTGAHVWRMAAYSAELARAAGWSVESCRLIELAAPLHDTGKIGVPDHILGKPGPLDEDEWALMRRHPLMGHEILSKSAAPVFQMAAEIALHHHEKWDGSGYPHGIAGTAIPESARIVAIADVYDALTMKRAYKDAWPAEQALAFISEQQGRHFDPRLAGLFLALAPKLADIQRRWQHQFSPPLPPMVA